MDMLERNDSLQNFSFILISNLWFCVVTFHAIRVNANECRWHCHSLSWPVLPSFAEGDKARKFHHIQTSDPGDDLQQTVADLQVFPRDYRLVFGRKEVLVTGSPGVGKSCFLLFYFSKLVQQKQRVLYVSSRPIIFFYGTRFVQWRSIRPPECWTLDPLCPSRPLLSSDLVCLFDGGYRSGADYSQSAFGPCRVVMGASPVDPLFRYFNKIGDILTLFFPIWLEAEWASICPKGWESRYRVWGGIPRSVVYQRQDPETELRQQAWALPDGSQNVWVREERVERRNRAVREWYEIRRCKSNHAPRQVSGAVRFGRTCLQSRSSINVSAL